MSKSKQTRAVVTKDDPSAARQVAIAKARQRVSARPQRASVALTIPSPGVVEIASPHNDADGGAYEVTDVFATASNGWVSKSLMDVTNAAKAKGCDPTPDDVNAALAFMSAVNPQDELESALAQQMYAAHSVAMAMAVNCKQAGLRAATQEYGTLATKMMRTFTAQLEALGKHRRGGEQVVRHVHQYIDNRGGQAIIAETVQTGGSRDGGDLETQPYAQGALGPALLGQDPAGLALSIPGAARQEAMPDARISQPRRAER